LRGHAPAEGFAAGDKREIGQGAGRPCDGGADGGVRELRRIGPLRAALNVVGSKTEVQVLDYYRPWVFQKEVRCLPDGTPR